VDGESALAVRVELWLNMQILLLDSHRLLERLPPSLCTCQSSADSGGRIQEFEDVWPGHVFWPG
jgi:hypothetical protein